MKNLYLITDNYPFEKGEASFVEPELEYLRQYFNVIIVSRSVSKNKVFDLPSDERLIHIPQCTNNKKLLPFIVKGLLDRIFWKEIIFSKSSFKVKKEWLIHYGHSKDFEKRFLDTINIDKDCDDIFYSFWYTYAVTALSLAKKKYPKIKLVTRAHGYDLYKYRNEANTQSFKDFTAKVCDKIIFISNAGKEYFLNNWQVDKDKCIVSYLGTIDEGKADGYSDFSSFNIYTCGNLIDVKNIELLLNAFKFCDFPIKYTCIGGGYLLEKLKNMANDLPNNITVNFTDAMPHDKVIQWLNSEKIHALVSVSKSEGLPVTMMEAQCKGLPIIASDVGGVSEIVNENNGILFSKDISPSELAKILKDFYEKLPSQQKSMSENARKHWENNFKCEKNSLKLIEVLNNL